MSFLLDTNVVSELPKKSPDPGVVDWLKSVKSAQLYLSVIVVGEIKQGVERLAGRDPQRATAIDDWRQRLVRGYSDRIVPVSLEVAETWGRLNASARLPLADGLMAATALVYNWTFVTRNVADVERTGVRLLNPFGN
ncbi:type II toxin-antitoxin system VapC family toxin [Kribbella speibonae]|uniref:Type II toxin-antitoxin system VapC family toxin n=1 Tax=Kribbella speibonae TaxID=1572660 RepID=A0A4R0IAN4_9ACTN|nr:type II toxin-antitoxin system VapC family toxin [Kribbella speibonae]TCC30103.1 type II toxin-antitoxin system VapC family toxin [Kribbella speibonae]